MVGIAAQTDHAASCSVLATEAARLLRDRFALKLARCGEGALPP
ncbi:hypothetical protein M446_3326 [Methylobacterium sp. 4-46]|nr:MULTISPECIES: hypothetical protein [Methylobacterium]ACA17729.1 hypothetical protein M446_3326 [Methylobacterium sp. 4-46]WFT83398.1 hypothetical protein QA634_16860 [Methylobacterium nodulans]